MTVFLILYLWHADKDIHHGYRETSIAMNGGPVLRIEPMPSLSACEAVGAAAKQLADAQPRSTQPAQFRCIRAPK